MCVCGGVVLVTETDRQKELNKEADRKLYKANIDMYTLTINFSWLYVLG